MFSFMSVFLREHTRHYIFENIIMASVMFNLNLEGGTVAFYNQHTLNIIL